MDMKTFVLNILSAYASQHPNQSVYVLWTSLPRSDFFVAVLAVHISVKDLLNHQSKHVMEKRH